MRFTFTWSAPPAAQHGWLLIFAYAPSHHAMFEHRPRSCGSATENRLALILSAQMLAVLRASGHGVCSLLVRAAAAIVVRMGARLERYTLAHNLWRPNPCLLHESQASRHFSATWRNKKHQRIWPVPRCSNVSLPVRQEALMSWLAVVLGPVLSLSSADVNLARHMQHQRL